MQWTVIFLITLLGAVWLVDRFSESCLQVEQLLESHGLQEPEADPAPHGSTGSQA